MGKTNTLDIAMGVKPLQPGNWCSVGDEENCLSRDRGYFNCGAVVGGTEETVIKVRGFWINILASQRTRIRKECERGSGEQA